MVVMVFMMMIMMMTMMIVMITTTIIIALPVQPLSQPLSTTAIITITFPAFNNDDNNAAAVAAADNDDFDHSSSSASGTFIQRKPLIKSNHDVKSSRNDMVTHVCHKLKCKIRNVFKR